MGGTRWWCRCAGPWWRHIGGGVGAQGCGGVIQAVQIQPLGFTIIRSVSKTRTS